MKRIELEKTTNEIKGVAGTLLMMSEIPEGTYQWGDGYTTIFLDN